MNLHNLAMQCRAQIRNAKRIVVKVGTHVLVDHSGQPNQRRIAALVKQLAQLHNSGREVILVTSGAVGAGLKTLSMKRRPTAIVDLQMSAAIGQIRLLDSYSKNFNKYRCQIGQVLLTHADLKHRSRHLNARNTMLNLLRHRIIPIVNENDVVAVDEIKLGDNDILSSLVTVLIDANLLILLTTPDGLRKPISSGKTRRVAYIERIDQSAFELVSAKRNALSTGGMTTKLYAAQTAINVGAMAVIASGNQPQILLDIMDGKDVGTLIGTPQTQLLPAKRKSWINYFHRTEGKIIIDAGAQDALINKRKSLLPAGIVDVTGDFSHGAQVSIFNQQNLLIGNGLVEYSSEQIAKIKGHRSTEIQTILGFKSRDVVIHRDNLVIHVEKL